MALTDTCAAFGMTALTDSRLVFDEGIFTGAEAGHVGTLLRAAGKTEVQTHCNAFLLRSGDAVLLVDTGTGGLFGPSSGRLMAALAEAGVAPEEVTHLFLTHLHPDHVAGAVTPSGAAVFPAAEFLLTAEERAFWMEESHFSGADEALRGWQRLATTALAAYGDRLRLVRGDETILPGISVLSLPGHTPGHAGLRIEAGGRDLLHMGDVVHVQDVQLSDPSLGVIFDVDAAAARATRLRTLEMLAQDGSAVTGAHLLDPKFGRIERYGPGYRFQGL